MRYAARILKHAHVGIQTIRGARLWSYSWTISLAAMYMYEGESSAAVGRRTESMSFYRDRHQGPIPHISNKIVFSLLLAVCSTYLPVQVNLRWVTVIFNLHCTFVVKTPDLRVWFPNKHTVTQNTVLSDKPLCFMLLMAQFLFFSHFSHSSTANLEDTPPRGFSYHVKH